MELHPCACGETSAPDRHRLLSGEAGLIARYDGACPRCGSLRRFDFALADEIVPLDVFGGAQPSTIIDAGQFLAYADAAAQRDDETWLRRAVFALDEVLKLIPSGDDRVPGESITSADGRAFYDREPGRFRRARLEAVRGAYVKLLEGE